ncbi:MAG: hypothetical protein WAX57_03495 [Minisyncoccia bacterium]
MDLLLECLRMKSLNECALLSKEKRRVENGLLSVGIKLHVIRNPERFFDLIWELGGVEHALEKNVYKKDDAEFCIVLPPLGSAGSAISLIRCIEAHVGTPVFGNTDIQLQICSPGRLDARRAALLAIMFYLGSDTLRRYSFNDFATTVSYDAHYNRGRRLVIYDAGTVGAFERDFAWWARTENSFLIRDELPFKEPARTDIIVGTGSPDDVRNINRIATLLVHAQHPEESGYWHELGISFERDVHELLTRHHLTGLLEAPWVHSGDSIDMRGDQAFFSALQELTMYAFEEVERLDTASRFARMWSTLQPGILQEAHLLLESYRMALNSHTRSPGGAA